MCEGEGAGKGAGEGENVVRETVRVKVRGEVKGGESMRLRARVRWPCSYSECMRRSVHTSQVLQRRKPQSLEGS